MAVQVLKARGVPEERILFLNLIASPEGVRNFATKFPKLKVVTAFIDEVCNEPWMLRWCQQCCSETNIVVYRDWMRRSKYYSAFLGCCATPPQFLLLTAHVTQLYCSRSRRFWR